MNPPRFLLTLKRIGNAYYTLIKNTFFLILFIVAVIASGFAISYPLWIFATRNQKGYSITALLLLAGGLVTLIIVRIYRAGRASRKRHGTYKKQVVRGFIYTGSIIGFIVLLYIVIFLFVQSMFLLGAVLLILFLFLLGLFLYDVNKART